MSSPALLAPAAFLVFFGLVMVALGWQRQEERSAPAVSGPGPVTRLRHRWQDLPRVWRLMWVVAVCAGLVAFLVTGWVVLLVIVPAAILGLPWLLAAPTNHELIMLQALDQWVRLLATSLLTGKSVPDAIRATRHQAPEALAAPVQMVVSRLDGRWSTTDALRAMADDLDSVDADAVIAALMLASQRGGTGTSETLHALAEATQERLRAMREVEAERSKPRIVVRQVTMITVAVLGFSMVVGHQFFAPYGTAVGQVVLAALLAAYIGALVVLRQRTLSRRRDRILTGGWA